MRIAYLLDENLRDETLAFLRGLGLDVTSVREQCLHGASDAELQEWACENGRIVVTFNADFADIRSVPPGANPGVIRLRIEPQTIEVVHPVLAALFRTVPHGDFAHALTTVTNSRVRIRREP